MNEALFKRVRWNLRAAKLRISGHEDAWTVVMSADDIEALLEIAESVDG